jgi:hypothetical protein
VTTGYCIPSQAGVTPGELSNSLVNNTPASSALVANVHTQQMRTPLSRLRDIPSAHAGMEVSIPLRHIHAIAVERQAAKHDNKTLHTSINVVALHTMGQ